MDRITKEQARLNIVELRLPQIVLDVFDEKPLSYDLDIEFGYPYQLLDHPEIQTGYGTGRITPIWTEAHWSIFAYHHAAERQGFFRFGIEDREELEPIGMNWQQGLVEPFKILWESDFPEEALRQIAGMFDFRHIDRLLYELPNAKLDTHQKSEAWYQGFVYELKGPA